MASKKLRSIERTLLIEGHGKKLFMLRSMPAHAARYLTGIALPPHERYWLSNYFLSYGDNITVGSRGTSKTFCHGSLAAELDSLLHKGLDTLVVSASGFRGGKLLLEDARRLVQGELRSQKLPAPYLMKSLKTPKVIRQEPDRWMIPWTSFSQVMTVPSNNAEAMRGIRARKAVIDEFNFFDHDTVTTVIIPMMNVSGEFEKVARGGEGNALYKTSTIDYTFRPAWKEIDTMRRTAKRQWEVMTALLDHNDHAAYDRGMAENKNELVKSSLQYSRFDYTDLLLPTEITDGEESYEVHYPMPPNLVREDLVKWDDRDQVHYWYLYPVSKATLEEPLLNGTMDEDLWLAENRNVFIEASGSVYPDLLVKKASEMPIYQPGDIEGLQEEFLPPVMLTCGDVCVVGVDYAREKDDFAIVVFRLGPLSDGPFVPEGYPDAKGRTCYGQTQWSSVIWAESWPHTTADQAATKMRDLMSRFNIINGTTLSAAIGPNGPGGIGMDARGGGLAVRDELGNPKAPTLANGLPDPAWKEPVKLYDPHDESFGHYAAFDDPDKYWSGLRLLTPPNAENWEWTRYTKAAMEQGLMYIGYYEAPGTWAARMGITTATGQKDQNNDLYTRWLIGYNAIRKLKSQLVRLQTEMTPSGLIRVTMPGKKGTEEGKKDLYSAFIYGWHMAREHLVNATREDPALHDVQPVMVQMGGGGRGGNGYGGGYSPLARIGWDRIIS
jgi:hypothetical protein